MSWANWLLGNELDATVVEITLGGFTVVAEDDCVLALAGADLGAQVNGEALAPWRSFRLNKGQRLQFTQPWSAKNLAAWMVWVGHWPKVSS